MLILPKGYAAKKAEWAIEETTGILDKPTLKETGFSVTQEVDKRDDMLGTVLKWLLPETFCPDCERRDAEPCPEQSEGVYVFDEPRPDLEVRPGDVIIYYRCKDCYEASLWDEKSKLRLPPMYQAKYRRAKRVGKNVVSWIKAQLAGGNRPLTEGHSHVRSL